jgi:predicted  nucleic acid-binding Zn-ribbon protein
MSQTRALYRLQKLDLELESRRARAREVTAALEDDGVPQETRAADLSLEIKTVAEQTKQLNARLYGGTVNNPKELEDLQHKIAERQRRHAALEDALLETMIAVEELQEALSAARAHLQEVEQGWAATQAALKTELDRLKNEIRHLKADRQQLEQTISAEYLALYQNLRARKNGYAVAALEGDSCSICGVGQTTATVQQVRQGLELITCESCGRILIAL